LEDLGRARFRHLPSRLQEVCAPVSLNHIVLLGRVDHTPELRFTPDGQPVTRMLLHVDHPDGSGSDSIRIIARRDLAESIAGLLHKHDLATVEGRLLMRTYQTKEGFRHKVAEVEAERISRVAPAPPAP
jgi:single-strand DNA-binding protein